MLTIRDLTKKYKTGRGIEGISISVEKGQVYGLLGPNGAGKTTLLKVATGLLQADDGVCTIDDHTITGDKVAYKRRMTGMIGDTVLYDWLSPMEHLSFASLKRDDLTDEDKHRVLEEMALLPYKDEPVKQFSTGMKQRVAFAMCLLEKPDVLFLDEPFSGLDIEGKLLIRDSLKRLSEEKETAVVISSHLIHDLEEIATDVGIIREGILIDEKHVADLLVKHRNLEDYFIANAVQLKEGA